MWIDITKPLEPGMTVYPGDPAFELRTAQHNIYKVSHIAMSVHCGTHIDAPSHFLLSGDTEDYPASQLCGEALVLDWHENWLDRAYQNRGLGARALRELIAYMKENHGMRVMTTTYIMGNEPAKRLYEHAGFTVTDVVDEDDCHEVNMIYEPPKD